MDKLIIIRLFVYLVIYLFTPLIIYLTICIMYYVLCIILFICVSCIASIPKNSNVKVSCLHHVLITTPSPQPTLLLGYAHVKLGKWWNSCLVFDHLLSLAA